MFGNEMHNLFTDADSDLQFPLAQEHKKNDENRRRAVIYHSEFEARILMFRSAL